MAEELTAEILQPWQAHLTARLEDTPHATKIYWYWEAEGNTGKSWLATYLAVVMDAAVFGNGKSADIKYVYQGERIVAFDFARTKEEHINFSVIKEIKNGRFFSAKYESKFKICFANHEPKREAMSKDRWYIHHIGDMLSPWGNHFPLRINQITPDDPKIKHRKKH